MLHVITASRTLLIPLVLLSAVLVSNVHAADGTPVPVQLSIWNPVQIFDSERSVRGFRYSLLRGVNRDVVGLDLSTVMSSTEGDVIGVQWALVFNDVKGSVWGLQSSALANQAEGGFLGLQLGVVNLVYGDMSGVQLSVMGARNRAGHTRGVQVGAMISIADELIGAQVATLANVADNMTGLQCSSLFNVAEDGIGVQISGLLNIANDMKGLQLGLLNFNKNGFLPFFPLFNFGL